MKAADNPATRTIKPKLELIDQLSFNRGDTDRGAAARELWDYACESGLSEMVKVVPACQMNWAFEGDDKFLFQRREAAAITSFEQWAQHLGIEPAQIELVSEVTNSDWTSLVRSEAVRQQKPFNSSAFAGQTNVRPRCVGHWNGSHWKIQFDDIDWLHLNYEGPVNVQRPAYSDIEEQVVFALAEAEKLIPKHAGHCSFTPNSQPWFGCVSSLTALHEELIGPRCQYAAWVRRVWCCVWPTVYREQNVLRDKADVEIVRSEMAECIKSVPKLTVWMFVFAKLVCQTQTGMGLGICADYVN